MNHKSLSLKLAKIEKSETGFAGYASVFGNLDSDGDVIEAGAFDSFIESGVQPKMFFNHDSWEVPIGKWTDLQADEYGLYGTAEFVPGYQKADDVKAALKAGALDALSVGFRVKSGDYEETDTGRNYKNISDLLEISVVNWGANPAARVNLDSIKSKVEALDSWRELERFLRDSGGYSKSAANMLIATCKRLSQGEPEPNSELIKSIDTLLTTFKKGNSK